MKYPVRRRRKGGQMADENVEKRKLILMCRQQVTQSKGGEEEAKKRGGREDIIFAATNCLRKSEPRNFKSGRAPYHLASSAEFALPRRSRREGRLLHVLTHAVPPYHQN